MSKTPTLAEIQDAFAGFKEQKTYCLVGRTLNEVEEPARGVLVEKVADPDLSARMLILVFKRLGLPAIGKDTMTLHRKRECRCPHTEEQA